MIYYNQLSVIVTIDIILCVSCAETISQLIDISFEKFEKFIQFEKF